MIRIMLQLVCTLSFASILMWAFGALIFICISGVLFCASMMWLLAREVYDAGGESLPFSRFLESIGLAVLIGLWPILPIVFAWSGREPSEDARPEGDA